MARRAPNNKHHWTQKEISFIRENFDAMTNHQLAAALGLKVTLLRMKCYELGLKRMELEYWTDQQVEFLRQSYKTIGDKELASIFNNRWKKEKGWTLKHIEKKRRYLKLNRTIEEIRAIKERNVQNGCFKMCPVKAWDIRGRAPVGEVRYWRKSNSEEKFPVVKTKNGFVHWGKWAWEQAYGPIEEGMNVVFKDSNPYNLAIENLVLLSNAELSRRNSEISSQGLSDNYIAGILTHRQPELRELVKQDKSLLALKRKQIQLNRAIYEQEIS